MYYGARLQAYVAAAASDGEAANAEIAHAKW